MGEMADYYLERDLLSDDHDCEEGPAGSPRGFRHNITCRNCKQSGLHWDINSEGKYRLYRNEDNALHNCAVKPLIEVSVSLLNCPKCQVKPTVSEVSDIDIGVRFNLFTMECQKCGRRSALTRTEEEAREDWNLYIRE